MKRTLILYIFSIKYVLQYYECVIIEIFITVYLQCLPICVIFYFNLLSVEHQLLIKIMNYQGIIIVDDKVSMMYHDF